MQRYKYPRTPHLPFSSGFTGDDERLMDLSHFLGRNVIVTEKMDGENTTLYRDYLHARSIDGTHHESRAWLKQFWATIRFKIPEDYRVCGENLYAQHSIAYTELPSFFLGFSMWDKTLCFPWNLTVEMFERIGVTPVNVLYQGVFDEALLKSLYKEDSGIEGFVVRLAVGFRLEDFSKSVAKFVRLNHVQTDEHWMYKAVIPNKLRSV